MKRCGGLAGTGSARSTFGRRELLRFSQHAAKRLRERGVSEEDAARIVARPTGPPGPGDNGALVYGGNVMTADGMIWLNVVIPPDDGSFVKTVYWSD